MDFIDSFLYIYFLLLQLELCRLAALSNCPSSSIVQFIFYFLSFHTSINILRIQKNIGLDPFILNRSSHLDPNLLYISYLMTSLLKLEITIYVILASIAGSFRVTNEVIRNRDMNLIYLLILYISVRNRSVWPNLTLSFVCFVRFDVPVNNF